jgi:hypothetical protein
VYPVVPVFDFKLLDAAEFVWHASIVSSLKFLPTLSEVFKSTELRSILWVRSVHNGGL